MSIKTSINRIKAWLDSNAPELSKLVGKPTSKTALSRTKKKYVNYGRELPLCLCDYLSVMNGQTDDMEDEGFGLIPAGDEPFKLHSTRMLENDAGLPEAFTAGKYECSKEIQPCIFDSGWFCFATDWDKLLAVDMNPTNHGKRGQIIAVDYDSPLRAVVSDSLETFFKELAIGFESGNYTWDGSVLRPVSSEMFPHLTSLKDLITKPSSSPSAPSVLKGKFLVTIRSNVEVRSPSGRLIRSKKKLAKLDGQFSQDSTLNYLDELNRGMLLDGGQIQFQYDSQQESVSVVTNFSAKKKLTKKQLAQLMQNVAGQWSDGLGTSFRDDIENEFQLSVDLCFETSPSVLQETNQNAE